MRIWVPCSPGLPKAQYFSSKPELAFSGRSGRSGQLTNSRIILSCLFNEDNLNFVLARYMVYRFAHIMHSIPRILLSSALSISYVAYTRSPAQILVSAIATTQFWGTSRVWLCIQRGCRSTRLMITLLCIWQAWLMSEIGPLRYLGGLVPKKDHHSPAL